MAQLDKPDYVSVILCHYSQRDHIMKESNIRKELLRKCIDSLEKHTDYPAEIIMVDNGGKNDDSDFLVSKVRDGLINTYVRNKDNMFFGWAWNQGVKLATSNHFVFATNDVIFKEGWLSTAVDIFASIPKKAVVALTGSKPKYDRKGNDQYHFNKWAGSDCMLMTKDIYYDVGEYTTHYLAGSQWFKKLHTKGYDIAVPNPPRAEGIGVRKGFTFHVEMEVRQNLYPKGVADFTDPYQTGGLVR